MDVFSSYKTAVRHFLFLYIFSTECIIVTVEDTAHTFSAWHGFTISHERVEKEEIARHNGQLLV